MTKSQSLSVGCIHSRWGDHCIHKSYRSRKQYIEERGTKMEYKRGGRGRLLEEVIYESDTKE